MTKKMKWLIFDFVAMFVMNSSIVFSVCVSDHLPTYVLILDAIVMILSITAVPFLVRDYKKEKKGLDA